jgi:hypothetical protein
MKSITRTKHLRTEAVPALQILMSQVPRKQNNHQIPLKTYPFYNSKRDNLLNY